MNTKQIVSIITIIILVLNIALFAMKKISVPAFWTIIIMGFLIQKFVVPKL